MIDLRPLGDRAVLATFSTEAEAARWVGAIRSANLPGVEDVSLAYSTAAVYANPDRVENWEGWLRQLRSVEVAEDLTAPADGRVLPDSRLVRRRRPG